MSQSWDFQTFPHYLHQCVGRNSRQLHCTILATKENVEILAHWHESETTCEMRKKYVNVSKHVDFIFHIFAAQEFRPSRDPNYAIHQGPDFFIGVDKKICATNWPKVPVLGLRTLIAHLHRWWTNIPSKGKVNFVGGFFLGPSNSWVHRVKHTQVVKRL